jgi:hypothetical protein
VTREATGRNRAAARREAITRVRKRGECSGAARIGRTFYESAEVGGVSHAGLTAIEPY